MRPVLDAAPFVVLMWLCQTAALGFFKYGGLHPDRRLAAFVIGNIFGITGTWFTILVYRHLNVNVATGLLLGGGFLVSQIVLAMVYGSRITAYQWAGLFAIACGMMAMAMLGPEAPAHTGGSPSPAVGAPATDVD